MLLYREKSGRSRASCMRSGETELNEDNTYTYGMTEGNLKRRYIGTTDEDLINTDCLERRLS